MKKTLLVLAILLTCLQIGYSQPNTLIAAPPYNLATSMFRAPNGTAAYANTRGCALVLASELTQLAPGTGLTLFGFQFNSANATVPVTGNFTVYLQHTSDLTYTKGTSFATAITGMTSIYASTMTIPVSAVTGSIVLTLPSAFTYTGGGLYVAFDFQSTGPFDTGAGVVFQSNNSLAGGCVEGNSATTPPVTMAASSFRPSFLFGKTNPNSNDVEVISVIAPGKLLNSFPTTHSIQAIVKNSSNGTLSNITVSLNVTGANPFTSTTSVASLTSGASTTVSFAPYTPVALGASSISVNVGSDDINTNNTAIYTQSITCNTWAQNPAGGTYTYAAIGFGTGSGILATPLVNPFTTTLTGMRAAVSNDAASVGNSVYGALLSSAGVVIATTPPFTITNAMLGTLQTVSFPTSQTLTAGTSYYIGFAQQANVLTAYYPAGTYASNYVDPSLYVTLPLAGGAITPLGANYGYFDLEAVFQSSLNVTAISPTVSCGNTTTLNAVSPTNYSWTTGATTSSIIVTPTITTSYTVSATNAAGCSASTKVVVTVTVLPLSVSSSTVICGNTASLNAQSAANYSWSNGATTASISVTPSTTTFYTVTTNGIPGCTASKTTTVTVTPLQVSAAASSSAICLNSAVTLTGSGASTYVWSVSGNSVSTGSVFTATPTVPTTYLVTGANPIGCTANNNISVLVNGLPLVAINSSVQAVCLGSSITMTVSGAATYTWITAGAPTTTVLTQMPVATTIYTVTATDANGCVNTGTTQIDVNAVTLSITGSTAICSGKSGTLIANGADSYLWNNSTPFQEYHVTPSVTTVYTVNGTNATTGCTGTETITLIVNNKPPVQATSANTAMCTGESMTFNGSGATTYTWSGISISGSTAMNASITVSPAVPATNIYTLSGTDINGCTATSTLVLRIDGCTGIKQNAATRKNSFIFPNPNNGLFTVSIDNADSASLEIYNSLGALIRKQLVDSEQTQIDLRNESNGIYLVYVIDRNKAVSVSKIIKQ